MRQPVLCPISSASSTLEPNPLNIHPQTNLALLMSTLFLPLKKRSYCQGERFTHSFFLKKIDLIYSYKTGNQVLIRNVLCFINADSVLTVHFSNPLHSSIQTGRGNTRNLKRLCYMCWENKHADRRGGQCEQTDDLPSAA